MAKHHNIIKKPKLILPALGSALQTGASAFGKRAGLLLANKLFGVETEGFGFKKKNKNQNTSSSSNSFFGGMDRF